MANRVDIRGAVPVLAMPFDEDGAIDEDSLRREIDFCLEAGSQAICFGVASESNQLTDEERARVWRLAGRHLNGAVPLIVATSHPSREGTIALTRLARDCGADCAMIDPGPRAGERLVALFRDLSERVGMPLMIQDAGGNAPVDVLLQAAREASSVVAGKLEAPGAPLKIGQFVAGLRESGHLAGRAGEGGGGEGGGRITVLGGAGGNYVPEELEAGAVGTMPYPAIIDAFRAVCDRYAAGDPAGGYEAYLRQVVPLLRAVAVAGPGQGDGGGTSVWVHKALLVRAGVLRTPYCRAGNTPAPEAVMARVWQHAERAGLLVARRAGRPDLG
jgi:4-hydroxy-tetrahydrodipicolinate synthase